MRSALIIASFALTALAAPVPTNEELARRNLNDNAAPVEALLEKRFRREGDTGYSGSVPIANIARSEKRGVRDHGRRSEDDEEVEKRGVRDRGRRSVEERGVRDRGRRSEDDEEVEKRGVRDRGRRSVEERGVRDRGRRSEDDEEVEKRGVRDRGRRSDVVEERGVRDRGRRSEDDEEVEKRGVRDRGRRSVEERGVRDRGRRSEDDGEVEKRGVRDRGRRSEEDEEVEEVEKRGARGKSSGKRDPGSEDDTKEKRHVRPKSLAPEGTKNTIRNIYDGVVGIVEALKTRGFSSANTLPERQPL